MLFKTLEVNDWDGLKNMPVRVCRNKPQDNLYAIGHIVKDLWFNPHEEFEKLNKVKGKKS